jgi:hypothetical protein
VTAGCRLSITADHVDVLRRAGLTGTFPTELYNPLAVLFLSPSRRISGPGCSSASGEMYERRCCCRAMTRSRATRWARAVEARLKQSLAGATPARAMDVGEVQRVGVRLAPRRVVLRLAVRGRGYSEVYGGSLRVVSNNCSRTAGSHWNA